MPAPSEHKTVKACILAYAQEIGWTLVSRTEAERRRGFDADTTTVEERARRASLYFSDLLHGQLRAFNPLYQEAESASIGQWQRLPSSIAGNSDFLTILRNQSKFFCAEANRELDLLVIDYADLKRAPSERRNVYEVTEEFYFTKGRHGTREDVVFLINGIPVLVIECKNAGKDEGIALGVDQIRRYHDETPEVMVPEMLFTATEAIGFCYGVTWNTVRRNLFNWKLEEPQRTQRAQRNEGRGSSQDSSAFSAVNPNLGNLEMKVKTFCAIPQVLRFLKDWILFAEKDEELQKIILRQHQTTGADKASSGRR